MAPLLRSLAGVFAEPGSSRARVSQREDSATATHPTTAHAGGAAARSHFSSSSKSRPTRGYGPPVTPPLERISPSAAVSPTTMPLCSAGKESGSRGEGGDGAGGTKEPSELGCGRSPGKPTSRCRRGSPAGTRSGPPRARPTRASPARPPPPPRRQQCPSPLPSRARARGALPASGYLSPLSLAADGCVRAGPGSSGCPRALLKCWRSRPMQPELATATCDE
jgi:hypothetical protein